MKLFTESGSTPALEQLELEKLLEKKEQNNGNLEFDDLVDETKEQIDRKEESEETEAAPADPAEQPSDQTTEEPGERVSGEETDPDQPDASADADPTYDDETEDPPAEEISAESLRDKMTYETARVLLYSDTAFESYENQDYYNIKPSAGEKVWSLTKDAFRYLGFLGIRLTTDMLPKVLGQTFKGILYAFTQLAYGLMVGMTALDQYIRRRVNSFNNLRGNIQKAHHALELVQHAKPAEITESDVFADGRYVRQLSAGESIDLDRNLEAVINFVSDSIDGLGMSIKEDINSIRSMISYSRTGTTPDITDLLKPHISVAHLKAGAVPGFGSDNALLSVFHSESQLPGNLVLIAHLPTTENKGREEWVQAYRDSQIFLGVDKSRYKEVESIPYRSVDDLKKLLGLLERLCLVCIKHQAFYENMKRQKLEQRVYYRNYFEGLLNQKKKVSLKDSLIDLVTLKNHFVDKVYLPAAIDIHDYCVRVINSYLRYIEKNIKVLTP